MFVIRPARKNEIRSALKALLTRPECSASDLHRQIDALLRYVSKTAMSLDHCLIAEQDGQILTACLAVDSPGRTANVFLPNHIPTPALATVVVDMLDRQVSAAAQRDVHLLQGMVAPDADTERALFGRGGFQRLTELIYLERDVTRPLPPDRPGPPVTWEGYSSRTHEDFARVIQDTYEGSLDCAQLSGVRLIEDTLASHRATGDFDPRGWLLARNGSELLGVILLARLPERGSTEVVYMGLLPTARGRGYGVKLLRRAIDVARSQATSVVSLTVDVENTPARKLYASYGFEEVSRREVWMSILTSSR